MLETTVPLHPKERAYLISAILFLGDWTISCAAVFTGLALRYLQRGEWTKFTEQVLSDFSSAAMWILAASLISWSLLFLKTYEVFNVYRMKFWARNLLKSALLWPTVMLALIGLTQDVTLAPRLGIVYCVATLIAFLGAWRLLAFVFLVQPQIKQAASLRIIVVGWNEKAEQLRHAMRSDLAQLGEIIGCVPSPTGRFAKTPPWDMPVLGDFPDLARLVKVRGAHSILLADISAPVPDIKALIAFCNREMLEFQMVPEYFPALGSKLWIRELQGVPLLGINRLPLDITSNRVIKRGVDILGGAVGLILSLPVIAVFGLLVHMESPGPIIYRQRRASRFGRGFQIYKIRSMRLDAEEKTGAVWCKPDDSRRLKVGTLMRKWNIDELPQFWNVLKGDMSLVGLRPERPELIERFKEVIPNYNVRHEVRAGITGWAQIKGYRGDTDLRKRVEHDLHYLEN